MAHAFFIPVALRDQVALLAWRQRRGQQMRGGTFDFVEDASQVRHDDHAQLNRGARPLAANLVKRGDHAVQGGILAKEEKLVLALKIVVEICLGKTRGGGNVAHAGLREPANTELSSCSAQNFEAPRKIAPPDMAIASIVHLQFDNPFLQHPKNSKAAGLVRLLVSAYRQPLSMNSERLFRKRTLVQGFAGKHPNSRRQRAVRPG